MSEEPKRWKRGDIGPDGRVFWVYNKSSKNGERWMTSDKFDSQREYQREYQREKLATDHAWAEKQRDHKRERHREKREQSSAAETLRMFQAVSELSNAIKHISPTKQNEQ